MRGCGKRYGKIDFRAHESYGLRVGAKRGVEIGVFLEVLRSGLDQEVSRGCTETADRGERRRSAVSGFLLIGPPQFGQRTRSRPVSLNRSSCQLI